MTWSVPSSNWRLLTNIFPLFFSGSYFLIVNFLSPIVAWSCLRRLVRMIRHSNSLLFSYHQAMHCHFKMSSFALVRSLCRHCKFLSIVTLLLFSRMTGFSLRCLCFSFRSLLLFSIQVQFTLVSASCSHVSQYFVTFSCMRLVFHNGFPYSFRAFSFQMLRMKYFHSMFLLHAQWIKIVHSLELL